MRTLSSLPNCLFAPIDILSLVYFRIAFGAIMLWEVYRYFDHGWIPRYWKSFQFRHRRSSFSIFRRVTVQ